MSERNRFSLPKEPEIKDDLADIPEAILAKLPKLTENQAKGRKVCADQFLEQVVLPRFAESRMSPDELLELADNFSAKFQEDSKTDLGENFSLISAIKRRLLLTQLQYGGIPSINDSIYKETLALIPEVLTILKDIR